jgi:hypothetical protein
MRFNTGLISRFPPLFSLFLLLFLPFSTVTDDANGEFVPFVCTAGENPNEGYGVSCEAEGDFNGDGFRDVAVGAWLNDHNGENAGAIYMYRGDKPPDGSPDFIIFGPMEGEKLGFSLSSGDLNGDGCDELIAGAPESSRFGTEFGCAYILFGSRDISLFGRDVLTLRGQKLRSAFGFAVSGGEDFNCDGYDDAAVGAPGTGGLQGQAFLYLGGEDMDAKPDMVCSGAKPAEAFGREVSLVKDMNGDGFAEFAVGNPLKRIHPGNSSFIDHRERVGKVFLFCGSSEPDSLPEIVFEGKREISLFGWTVRGSDDLNGDGYNDLLVGAPRTMDFSTDYRLLDEDEPGHVYLYLGGEELDNKEDLTFEGESLSDGFGFSIVPGDDLNRAGKPDIAIGAPASDWECENSGAVYLFFGETVLDTIPDEIITGEEFEEFFSYSASAFVRTREGSLPRLLVTSEKLGTGVGYVYSDEDMSEVYDTCRYIPGKE